MTCKINSILVLFIQQLSITSNYFIIVLMSVVSFVHENDNTFPDELTLGFFSLVKTRLTRAFSSCEEWGLLFVAVRWLLIAVASLVAEHGL